MAQKPKKLLDRVREIIRLKQYSNKTGKACFFNRLIPFATNTQPQLSQFSGYNIIYKADYLLIIAYSISKSDIESLI